jgi:hypothetical protein
MRPQASILVAFVGLALCPGGRADDPIFVGGIGSPVFNSCRPDALGKGIAWTLKDAIDLTTPQARQAEIIFTNEWVDIQALGPFPRQSAVMPIRRRTVEQVRALLTPGQRAKFDVYPQRYGGGMFGLSPWDRLDRLDRLLHLTPSQKEGALKVLVEGTEVLMELQAPAEAPNARRVRAAMIADLRAVLSPEQQRILDESRARSKERGEPAGSPTP